MKRNWNICIRCPQVHKHKRAERIHCEIGDRITDIHMYGKESYKTLPIPDNCVMKLEYLVLNNKKEDRHEQIDGRFTLPSKW